MKESKIAYWKSVIVKKKLQKKYKKQKKIFKSLLSKLLKKKKNKKMSCKMKQVEIFSMRSDVILHPYTDMK